MRTLVVEDDAICGIIIEQTLRNRGHDVFMCERADEALRAAEQEFFPLVLCDIELPDGNGLDLCRSIRRQQEGSQTRSVIVVVTGHTDAVVEALRAGADDFVSKTAGPHMLDLRIAIAEFRIDEVAASQAARRELHAFRVMEEIAEADDINGALASGLKIARLVGWSTATAWTTRTGENVLIRVAAWPTDTPSAEGAPPHVEEAWKRGKPVERRDRLAIPLLHGRTVLAVLAFEGRRLGATGDTLAMVTVHLANVLIRKIQESILRFRLRAQEALSAFSREALCADDMKALMSSCASHLQTALQCDAAVIYRILWKGRMVMTRAWSGLELEGSGLEDGDGRPSQSVYTVLEGRTIVVDDYEREARFIAPPAFERAAIRSALSAIIPGVEDTYGTLIAASTTHDFFRVEHIPFVEAMAHLLSMAVRRFWMNDWLRQSEERSRAVIESLNELLAITDRSGIMTYQGPTFFSLLGYGRDELVRHKLFDMVHPDDRALARRSVARAFRAPGRHVSAEVRFRARTGEYRLFELNGAYLPQRSGIRGFLIVARDITERRATEDALRQTQKLEILGRLAGSIAHDFNNLLTVINGYCEILIGQRRADSALASDLGEILEAGQRAQELTAQLLAFSRKRQPTLGVVDVGSTLHGLRRLLSRMLGENIDLAVDVDENLPAVQADRHLLDQVMLNLAVNARDAMEGRGRLDVRASVAEHACEASSAASQRVLLTVQDDGCGMDAETLSNVFQPFFTTKREGAGTGLGLASVRANVEQWGGHIHVESEPGVGTTFTLCLLPKAPQPTIPTEVVSLSGPTAMHSVLIVEDDPAVRKITAQVLRSSGYGVIVASCADDALLLDLRRVSLVVTDIGLPGINGEMLARLLTDEYPHLRVVYTSGHLPDELERRAFVAHAVVLRKPYTAAALLESVQRALDPELALRSQDSA